MLLGSMNHTIWSRGRLRLWSGYKWTRITIRRGRPWVPWMKSICKPNRFWTGRKHLRDFTIQKLELFRNDRSTNMLCVISTVSLVLKRLILESSWMGRLCVVGTAACLGWYCCERPYREWHSVGIGRICKLTPIGNSGCWQWSRSPEKCVHLWNDWLQKS